VRNKLFILKITFLLSFFGGAGGNLYAQTPDLLDNSWFVHSITINGQTTVAPRDPEMTIQAIFNSNDMLNEMCCAGQIALQLTFDNTLPFFHINSINTIIENCTESNLNTFRDLYIDFFQFNTADEFDYDIQQNMGGLGNYLKLTITNPAGDIIELYNTPHDLQADYYIFGDDPPFQTHWYLAGMYVNWVPVQIPYSIAQQTSITFLKDGSFHSQICGEIVSKAAFINDDGGGSFGSGEFYILCEELTFTPGNCQNTTITDIEQHYYNFLQNLANGNIAVYQRGHADFADFCGSIEIIELYDPAPNTYVYFVDCLEPLSINTFNQQSSLIIYPNPTNDSLTIHTSFCNSCSVKIYSSNGKLLYSESLKSSQEIIDVKQLSSGIYFIGVENELGIKQTEKFVKK
jgi:hypothetical protein